MIKKLIMAAAISSAALTTSAEGYQVNTLSARQNGMGHTGTAIKLGAESMIFNPAGIAFIDDIIDAQASVTGIFAKASAICTEGRFETDNTPSTPMSVNLAMSVYDNFKVGVSFYTPYGSGINWGVSWPGAVLNEKVNLAAYTLQPTLAWRPVKNLAIGAGVMVTWGNVDLDKGLVSSSSFNALMAAMGIPGKTDDTPASVNLNGKAATTVGVNAGIMWDINSRWTVGASFRSKMNMKVKRGVATLSYANDFTRTILQERLDILDKANFEASMPCAAVYNLGVSFKPTEKWLLAADFQLTGWNAYKELSIDFLSEKLEPYDQHLTKNYHNSMTYHIGAQYSVTERLDLRAGMMIDTTPVNKKHYNPETPGMTKIEPSIGLSFSPVKNFSIDASRLYVAGLGENNASISYDDLLLGKTATFTADYKVHAWNPSIGLSFHF